MNFEYESDSLIYRILGTDSTTDVLDFYRQNRNSFEQYEPVKKPSFYTPSYHETLLRLEQQQFFRREGYRFWIYEKNTPQTIAGCVSFHSILRGCFAQTRIGYKVDSKRQHLGIGTEAVSFCTSLMFVEGDIHRIEAYIHPDNIPSLRLAQKCGFCHEGVARDFALLAEGWTDHERYVLINPL